MEPIFLNYSITVCTSCIEFVSSDNNKKYKTCDPHCYLPSIRVNILGSYLLRACWEMNWGGTCKKCKCSYKVYMHIIYENKEIYKEVEDDHIKKLIDEKKSDQEVISEFLKRVEKRINDLKKEQDKIIEISAKLANFLKQNAIVPFNDAFLDYLKHIIKQEREKYNVGDNEKNRIEKLENLKDHYINQKEIFEKAQDSKILNPVDVSYLVQQI